MIQIDENIKKQLDKPQTWFCKYFPKRIRNVGEKEIADRNLVYAFKDGKAYEEVARMTASSMKEQYGETCTDIVFSPVPADITAVTDSAIEIINGTLLNRSLNFEVHREPMENPYVVELLKRMGFDTVEAFLQQSDLFDRHFS